jgi:GAF domain-containing protein
MYDPLIVDTFAQVYREIAPDPLPSEDANRALQEITSSTSNTASLGLVHRPAENARRVDDLLSLFASAHALAGYASINDACDAISTRLAHVLKSTVCVFYLYDAAKDELEAQHAVGEGSSLVRGTRIGLGQRLSGWVAANRRTIVNSDPILDIGHLARPPGGALRSSLSTPLLVKDELVGVVTLYNREIDAFGDEDRRVIEVLAPQIALSLKRARDFDNASKLRSMMTTTNRDEVAFRAGRA